MSAIVDIIGREVIDSRGNPTVEVDVELEGGIGQRFLRQVFHVGLDPRHEGERVDRHPVGTDLQHARQPQSRRLGVDPGAAFRVLHGFGAQFIHFRFGL